MNLCHVTMRNLATRTKDGSVTTDPAFRLSRCAGLPVDKNCIIGERTDPTFLTGETL
jgi:hypothetical protein